MFHDGSTQTRNIMFSMARQTEEAHRAFSETGSLELNISQPTSVRRHVTLILYVQPYLVSTGILSSAFIMRQFVVISLLVFVRYSSAQPIAPDPDHVRRRSSTSPNREHDLLLVLVLLAIPLVFLISCFLKHVYMNRRRKQTAHAFEGQPLPAIPSKSRRCGSISKSATSWTHTRCKGLLVGCLGDPDWETRVNIEKLDLPPIARRVSILPQKTRDDSGWYYDDSWAARPRLWNRVSMGDLHHSRHSQTAFYQTSSSVTLSTSSSSTLRLPLQYPDVIQSASGTRRSMDYVETPISPTLPCRECYAESDCLQSSSSLPFHCSSTPSLRLVPTPTLPSPSPMFPLFPPPPVHVPGLGSTSSRFSRCSLGIGLEHDPVPCSPVHSAMGDQSIASFVSLYRASPQSGSSFSAMPEMTLVDCRRMSRIPTSSHTTEGRGGTVRPSPLRETLSVDCSATPSALSDPEHSATLSPPSFWDDDVSKETSADHDIL